MARSDSFVDTLSTVPLFSACSKKELAMVAKSAERVNVPAGQVVVNEGAAGTEFYVIIDGQARVERHGRQVAILGPGGFTPASRRSSSPVSHVACENKTRATSEVTFRP